MKRNAIISLFAAALLTSCTTTAVDPNKAWTDNRELGVIYHHTPRGNPMEPTQWEEWGPGAIRRNPDNGNLSAGASRIIGAPAAGRLATRANASPVEALDRKEIAEKDFNLLGSGPASIAATIKGKFNLSRETEVSVVMGKVYDVALSEQEMVDLCRSTSAATDLLPTTRTGLREGTRHLLLAARYADGMTYKFTRKSTTGGGVEASIPKAGDINIDGKSYKFTEAGLVMTEPRFLGYRILGREEVSTVF